MMVKEDISRVLRLRAEDADVSLEEAVALEQRAARHEAADQTADAQAADSQNSEGGVR